MLQVDDGLFVLPVGLDDHALEVGAGDAPGARFLLEYAEALVASLAGALPLLLVESGGSRLLLGNGATQLAHALTAGEHERLKAGARKRGNGEELVTVLEGGHLERLDTIGHAGGIALVGDDDLRTIGQVGCIAAELIVDDAVILERIAALIAARNVDHVQDQGRALDMTQELMAQALALGRALDETRDVGNDIGILAGTHHAEIGHERGERVVGDLGASGAHAGDERGLTDTRETHEGRIGHELHLELDPVLDGGLALLSKRRSTARGSHEVRVAQTAGTTGSHHDALPVVREVGQVVGGLHRRGIKLADDGAHGHLEDKVLAVGAVFARTLAVRAGLGAEMMLESIIDERRKLGVGLDDDIAAMTAVAAVGAAFGNKGLTAERHAAGAAVAALDVDAANIGELGHSPSLYVDKPHV